MWNLKKPCSDCPFRRDSLNGWLGERRAAEIIEGITGGEHLPFFCHKTTVPNEEGARVSDESSQHCAGAAILLHKTQSPNLAMRFGYVYGTFDGNQLECQDKVFDTPEEFIAHHAGGKKIN